MDPSDSELIERSKKGDKDAFGDIVRRHMKRAYYAALAISGEHSDAMDLSQEAFVRAYRGGQYDREKGRLSAWLFGIADRRVRHAWRKRAGQPRQMAAAQRTAFWDNLPDEEATRQSWDASWEQAVLDQCLQQVRAEVEASTIRAFELFALHGRPAADVAGELGMSRNAVFIAKHRVMKRVLELRRQFEALD